MAAADPLLDLTTLIPERPPIRIDGTLYHLRSPDELTLAESLQFTRWGAKLKELATAPDRADELEALVRKVATAALADVPEDVAARLSMQHRLSVIEVFTMLLLGQKARLAGAAAGALSTGAKSSHVSSRPTGATQAGGSTKPRRRSSGPT